MMDEQTIGMWKQWAVERAGNFYKPAIDEVFDLAIKGLRLSMRRKKLTKKKRKVSK